MIAPKRFDAIGREIVSADEWSRARRHGYTGIWDGRRHMLRLDPATGATVYREVVVEAPLIRRHRREG